MLLRRIKLTNFRQFKGEQTLELSSADDRSLTVILGDNTAGKTTLIQAFKWALYGKADFKTQQLLNNDVAKEMRKDDTEDVKVELTLVHNEVEYDITRTARYKSQISGSSRQVGEPFVHIKSNAGGQYRDVPGSPSVAIDKILPEDLSEYFFFDGEKIETVSTKRNLQNSVHTLMGLTPIKNMIDHLDPNKKGSAYAALRSKRVSTGDESLENLGARERGILKDIESDVSLLKRKREEQTGYQAVYDRAIRALEANKGTTNLQKTRERKERELNGLKRLYQNSLDDIYRRFNDNCFDIFFLNLALEADAALVDADVDDKGIPGLTADTLKYLLERDECICGTSLDAGTVHRESINQLISYVPPESIGTSISNYQGQLYYIRKNFKNNVSLLDKDYGDMLQHDEDITSLEAELNKLSHDLHNMPDGKELEKRRDEASSNLNRVNREIADLESREGNSRRNLQSVREQSDRISKLVAENKDVDRQLAYVANIHDIMCRIYDSRSERVLEDIRREVKTSFNSMYHGTREIIIGDDYSVSFSPDRSGNLEPSTGLNVVKNFAFVAGLLKIARDSFSSNDDEVSSEPYPLVMDAPFSNVDEKHIKNISEILPDVAEQVIMMIMWKDWNHVAPVVGNTIGGKYRLVKHSESHTTIEEVS